MARNQFTDADTAYRESLTIRRNLAEADPGNAQAQQTCRSPWTTSGRSRWPTTLATHAGTAYRESLTIRRNLAEADPGNAQAQRDLSVSLNNVGQVAMARNQLTDADTAYRESSPSPGRWPRPTPATPRPNATCRSPSGGWPS